jgi:hypothetical protein
MATDTTHKTVIPPQYMIQLINEDYANTKISFPRDTGNLTKKAQEEAEEEEESLASQATYLERRLCMRQ